MPHHDAIANRANSIEIRPVTVDDAPAVADLSAQLGYPAAPETMAARIQHVTGVSDRAVLVAILDQQIVGWVEVLISHHLHSGSYALLSGLVVREDVRSQRIGSRLCSAAEQWAKAHGQTRIRVRSQISRQDAHRFYLREGYRQTKTSAAFEKRLE